MICRIQSSLEPLPRVVRSSAVVDSSPIPHRFHAKVQNRVFTVAASYGPDDGSMVRRSAERCFGKFLDLLRLERVDSANLVAAERPQIFVDLMSHTFGARYGED